MARCRTPRLERGAGCWPRSLHKILAWQIVADHGSMRSFAVAGVPRGSPILARAASVPEHPAWMNIMRLWRHMALCAFIHMNWSNGRLNCFKMHILWVHRQARTPQKNLTLKLLHPFCLPRPPLRTHVKNHECSYLLPHPVSLAPADQLWLQQFVLLGNVGFG